MNKSEAFNKMLDDMLEAAESKDAKDRVYNLRKRHREGKLSEDLMTELLTQNNYYVSREEDWKQGKPVKK